MRLPWQRPELEQRDYTAQVIAAQVGAAAGVETSPATTAAVEAAAGLWGRGFALAEVTPEPASRLLTRELLADAGRSLALRGGWLAAIDVAQGGAISLTPSSSWAVSGGHGDYTYHANFAGPSSTRKRDLKSAEVLHLSYATDLASPWRDVSPLTASQSTARVLANLESSLGDELGIAVSQILMTTLNKENEADRAQLASLGRLKGRLGFLTGDTSDSGLSAPPTPTRIGHQVPPETTKLWDAAQQAIFNAYGVAGLFVTDATAAARREAYRGFVSSTLSPLASKLADAATAALPFGAVQLSFNELKANDLAARSRSLKALIEAGVALPDALELTGFD